MSPIETNPLSRTLKRAAPYKNSIDFYSSDFWPGSATFRRPVRAFSTLGSLRASSEAHPVLEARLTSSCRIHPWRRRCQRRWDGLCWDLYFVVHSHCPECESFQLRFDKTSSQHSLSSLPGSLQESWFWSPFGDAC